VNGNNTFTAIAKDVYGRINTNAITVNIQLTNSYSYDSNGNLLSDGTRNFAYDDENQLTSAWVASVWSNSFVYDGKMRKRIERDYTYDGSSWTLANEVHYIYDGNVVIQERDVNNLPKVTYTRGNDLSGSLQGAGGIGGLLARSDNSQMVIGSASAHAYYYADGNGNITMLINNLQSIVAKYLYDPFGNTLSLSGPLANANTYRFSSKEWNDNAGLYYYLYRFYDPNLQRWPNRDPIQERGGLNLYGFADNDSIDLGDYLGLAIVTTMSSGVVVVEVEKCEIVVDVGHGHTSPNSPVFLGPTHSSCPWAAGFMGCYASQVNSGIKGTVIPGSPGNSPGDSEWQGTVDQYSDQTAFQEKTELMKAGIAQLIADWFANKSACCKSVKLTFVIWGASPDSQTITTPSQTINWPKGF
jgi:RHS repeat-associated protein